MTLLPFHQLEWARDDWEITSSTKVFSKGYYVWHKDEIMTFEKTLYDAIEWIEKNGDRQTES